VERRMTLSTHCLLESPKKKDVFIPTFFSWRKKENLKMKKTNFFLLMNSKMKQVCMTSLGNLIGAELVGQFFNCGSIILSLGHVSFSRAPGVRLFDQSNCSVAWLIILIG
jgi:hypothetical protein